MNSCVDLPTIVVSFGDIIIFTTTSGKEVFSFNPKTSTFKSIYSRPNLKVAAMCATDSHVFLLKLMSFTSSTADFKEKRKLIQD